MTELFLKEKTRESFKELEEHQLSLLQRQLRRVYHRSRFYREKFDAAGVKPSQINSLKDFAKVPLTSREELEQNFKGILAVPPSEISTVRMSSGTTGNPLRVAHTKRDIAMITDASARRLLYYGATKKDVVQITSAYGLWQAAWSMHWGAERIGAFVIPVGPAETERQILLIKQFGTTILYAATNYHFRILEVAKSLGEDLSRYKLKLAVCVAEKPTKTQTEILKMEGGYRTVISDYGATEFPGFSVNCKSNPDVHHVWPEYYLVEVVDPKTHEPLGIGERGELVITSLQREAFPLVRYLSKDLTTYLGFTKCECGLCHPTISADIDREDSMTKIRGVTIFPSHIEFLLSKFPEVTGKCQIIVDKRTPAHEATLRVETAASLPAYRDKTLKQEITMEIKTRVGIGFNEVAFVPQGEFENKFKKVIVIS
ncbi:MAG: AMP-binding protein [Candidatus Bathyarchaeota archaeon]|nr:AMP-binding protein [Candidatus Bathyarchaeota archaeon]